MSTEAQIMANKPKQLTKDQQAKPARLGRMTMAPLGLEDALRGAMQVTPPAQKPKKKRAKKKPTP
jgi:hypothetical protein